MKRSEKFLGVGLAWPFTVGAGGGLDLSRAEADIAQSIRIILSTRPGERRMRPEFGCRIHDYVFSPNTTITHRRMEEAVIRALDRFENRIEAVEAKARGSLEEPDLVEIHVSYRVRKVNSAFNLVYPFYLEGS